MVAIVAEEEPEFMSYNSFWSWSCSGGQATETPQGSPPNWSPNCAITGPVPLQSYKTSFNLIYQVWG